MARDGRQILRFIQQAFGANTNQLQTNNYAMGATASTGAVISATTAGTAGFWYAGNTVALNRSGFRDTNADQSIIVSGETSAILNDPAIYGNTETSEQSYIRFAYAPFGPLNTTNVAFEIIAQAASDSGSGTAGTDWTQISDSQVVSPITSYAAKTSVTISGGYATYGSAHGLVNGQIVYASASTSPVGFVNNQPMFVCEVDPNFPLRHGLSLVPYAATRNTGLSATGVTIQYSGLPRIQVVALSPTAKPWVRLMFRALPSGNSTTVTQFAGCWIDNVGLSVGRDVPALI